MITKGHLRGYKASVIQSNDSEVQVLIHSKNERLTLPRDAIYLVYNEMDSMHVQPNQMNMHMSFDEAANKEYVNAQD